MAEDDAQIEDRREVEREFGRTVVRLAARWLALSLAAIAAAAGLRALFPEAWPARILAAGLEGFGIGFGLFFGLFLAAGVLALLMPSWRIRKIVGVTLLIAAAVAFLFVPYCWSPKSADCRSIAVRLRDGIAGSWRS